MDLLDKLFITEINLVSQIRPKIKDLTLNTKIKDLTLNTLAAYHFLTIHQ
jgi:hypothetical protein